MTSKTLHFLIALVLSLKLTAVLFWQQAWDPILFGAFGLMAGITIFAISRADAFQTRLMTGLILGIGSAIVLSVAPWLTVFAWLLFGGMYYRLLRQILASGLYELDFQNGFAVFLSAVLAGTLAALIGQIAPLWLTISLGSVAFAILYKNMRTLDATAQTA